MKHIFSRILSAILILSLLVTALPVIRHEVQAAGTTYYVSSSSGNDANSGTSSSKPWKTLKKVASKTFRKGDTILLKRGDTWKEILDLHAADERESEFVTVSAYGSGDRPHIMPGEDTPYAVNIYSFTAKNGGWKLLNLEISHSRNGIWMIDTRQGCDRGDTVKGLWVEDCYIHDIKGSGSRYEISGMATGLRTRSENSYIDHITVRNTTFERCDLAVQSWDARWFEYSDCQVLYSGYYGLEYHDVKYGTIKDCAILHTGTLPREFGTTGIQFDQSSQDVVVDSCEIAYTRSDENSPDGCAVDFESYTHNITVMNCYIHDNRGRAFLMMPYPSSETNLYNNYCVNNGTDHDSMYEPAFFLFNDNKHNNGEVSGNVIIKAEPNQSANRIDYEYTDSWPEAMYCHDNIIVEYGDTHPAPPKKVLPKQNYTDDLKVWDFTGGTGGWWLGGATDTVCDEGGYGGYADDYAPQLLSPENLSLPITYYPYIKVVMKNESSATQAVLSFMTDIDYEYRQACRLIIPIEPFDTQYREYLFDMRLVGGYSGTLKRISLNPVNGDGFGGFKVKSITLSANRTRSATFAPLPVKSVSQLTKTWDLSGGGWTLLGAKGTPTQGTHQKGQEAVILSADHLGASIGDANLITVKLQNHTPSATASLSFITNGDGRYNLEKTVHFPIKPNSGMQEYVVDLSSCDGFTGTLRQVRINPGRSDSGTFSVQSVSIGRAK